VSISTVRATPMPPGLSQGGLASALPCAGAFGAAVSGTAAVVLSDGAAGRNAPGVVCVVDGSAETEANDSDEEDEPVVIFCAATNPPALRIERTATMPPTRHMRCSTNAALRLHKDTKTL
jgi:hypothetical protein